MVGTLTYKTKHTVNLSVSSLKGNTLGILEFLDEGLFDSVLRIKNQPLEELKPIWDNSDVIVLGVSTYSSKYKTEPEFPKQLQRYRQEIEKWEGKHILLFGSGRSEYLLFCGALDYLEDMLGRKNNILLKFKFEGYPREDEKLKFAKKVSEIINEIQTTEV